MSCTIPPIARILTKVVKIHGMVSVETVKVPSCTCFGMDAAIVFLRKARKLTQNLVGWDVIFN